jgi:hypothetical protein
MSGNRALNKKVIDDWLIWNDLEGSARSLIDIQSRDLPGVKESNRENQSGQPVSRLRFETGPS